MNLKHDLAKVIVGAALLLLAACGSVQAAESTAVMETLVEASAIPPPVLASTQASAAHPEIEAAWKRGEHSKIRIDPAEYINACAQCHSPRDWEAAQPAEKPQDCAVSWIMAGQNGASAPTAGISPGKAVDCQVCHLPPQNGTYDGKLVFWDQATQAYEPVSSSRELCGKCHRKAGGMDHSVDLGTGAHAALDCTACHEPHRGTATCTNSGCHSNVAEDLDVIKDLAVMPGHETVSPHNCGGAQCHTVATQVAQENSLPHIGIHHGNLTCSACHDASGLPAAPIEASQKWTTWRPVEWNGKTGEFPYFSHNVQKAVDCTRCHYPQNPWGLSGRTGTPQP